MLGIFIVFVAVEVLHGKIKTINNTCMPAMHDPDL